MIHCSTKAAASVCHHRTADNKNLDAQQFKAKMEVEEISENKIATNDKAPERVIKESTTEIIAGGAVFYNPVQEFNRDLSISVLNVYSKRLIREREAAAHKNPQNTKESKQC
ncbi:tRNA (guanine(26)-N(2))-dimethyltransferase-like [Eurosta solidaginis]|uniref:tRNA (guanine(26)-N(2))-dimethyltransferase-like n=1 Tax=Eurosta solidaginis TaxID=178769 RepID=UPI0035309321